MKKQIAAIFLCLACSFALPPLAFAQDTAPIDIKELLNVLKQIKEKRSESEKTTQSKFTQDIRAASASNATAIAFYEQAIIATQFAGKVDDKSAYHDWKKAEADKLKSDAMQNAVRLHINYLLLTLQRAGGATTRQLEPALMAHIAALTAAGAGDGEVLRKQERAKDLKQETPRGPKNNRKNSPTDHSQTFWEQEMIKQGVNGSIFVKWYGVQKLFEDLKDWEETPCNVDGMYQKTLLPYYRETKDPRVIAYWDNKLAKEAAAITEAQLSAFKVDQFNRQRRPRVLWLRATDMIVIGLRNRGMTEMLGLIKTYPDHKDLAAWIQKLENLIKGGTASPGTDSAPVEPDSAE